MTAELKPTAIQTTEGKRVWLITGCSTGLGRALAIQALERGFLVAMTARNIHDLKDLSSYGTGLALSLDVTDQRHIDSAIIDTEQAFGRIDVLVNNAGIGYFAAVEESEEEQVHRMFDINVFGLSRMIHAVLPGMRHHRHGTIVNMSSIGGLRSFPGLGYYNATKFAVEGLSEALRQEIEPLGINVMLVEPSGFRTDWAGRSAQESVLQIADYAATAGLARKHLRSGSGKQAGDPTRAAQAIIGAVESPRPPHRLLLGNDAFEGAMAKIDELRDEFLAWESVSRAADFPSPEIAPVKSHLAYETR